MHSSTTSINYFPPPSLFDLETGKITPRFKRQLEISGISFREYYTTVAKDHIMNVQKELQYNGCFQQDCDFYKKGRISKFNLSYEQAKAFLNDEYRDRKPIMPRRQPIEDVIVCCGVEATMHKRFDSLKQFIDQGYTYSAIHFIVKDEDNRRMIEKMIKEKYRDLIKNDNFYVVVAKVDINVLEVGLKILNKQGVLGKRYVMITDYAFAAKTDRIAKSILGEKRSGGIVATPCLNWREEMAFYGYVQALGSKRKATIAWASSAWNFKAREVHNELAVYYKLADYNSNLREKKKKIVLYSVVGLVCLAIFANVVLKKSY